MKTSIQSLATVRNFLFTLLFCLSLSQAGMRTLASGGSNSTGGGGSSSAETIKVDKCFYDAPTGQMLIKASSSNTSAKLYAYRPDGTFQHEVQNGGGSRYGGTFCGWISHDPGYMVIKSSSGASTNAPTTPVQP